MMILVLYLELDGATPAEVAAYGEQLVMSIEERRTHHPDELVQFECRAGNVRVARLERADEL